MKNYLTFSYIIFFLFLTSYSTAQSDKSGIDTFSLNTPFVYLYDGTLLLEDEFTMKNVLFGKQFRYKDGGKIRYKKIKFYQDKHNYFGKYGSGFKQRINRGKFDVFYELDSDAPDTHPTEKYYYAKGFGDLKELTYENLYPDITVFPEEIDSEEQKVILDYLNQGKKRSKTKWILIGSGVGGLIAGIAMIRGARGKASDTDPSITGEPNTGLRTAGITVGLLGIGVGVSSLLVPKPQNSYYDALLSYNYAF